MAFQQKATLIGLSAIVLWASLALFTALSGHVPPLQLSAMSFAIASLIGIALMVVQPLRMQALRQPFHVWTIGVGGLFGFHFFYFSALRNAPPLEAGLISYLWPLFIVVGSALLPGERLRWFHSVGAVLGLAGCVLIITKGQSVAISADYVEGYVFAFGAAVFWSGYSLLSRTIKEVPTDAVTGFCFVTAVLSAIAHLALEQTQWPDTILQWASVFCLGLGPVGLAFYTWDFGVKHGAIQLLGVASYSIPLISTVLLLAFGVGAFHWTILVAALLITAGAVLASRDILFPAKHDEF